MFKLALLKEAEPCFPFSLKVLVSVLFLAKRLVPGSDSCAHSNKSVCKFRSKSQEPEALGFDTPNLGTFQY